MDPMELRSGDDWTWLAELSQHVDPDVRLQAVKRLARAGAIDLLVTCLGDVKASVRWEAVKQLTTVGSPAIEALVPQLKHTEAITRAAAADALGAIQDASAVPDLLAAMSDTNPSVRWKAVEALGKIGDSSAVPGLIDQLNEQINNVRQEVVVALAKIADPRSVPGLVGCIRDANPGVREAAVIGLGRIGDARAVTALLRCLMDPDIGFRLSCQYALDDMRDIRAVPLLLERLKDGDPVVRRGVKRALGSIDGRDHPPTKAIKETQLTIAERITLYEAIRAYYRMPDIVQFCRQHLTGSDAELRQEAAAVLAYVTLVRGSQSDTSQGELLRAASDSGAPVAAPELLRPSVAGDSEV